jgi:hypothetical protein
MLFNIKLIHTDGEITESIMNTSNDAPLTIYPNNNTKHSFVQRMMYDYKGNIPPAIVITLTGKYIVPGWIKIHSEATRDDINWIKDKPKPIKETKVFTFTSASMPGVEYKVTKVENHITCNCQGYFRSGGNCKHVKEVRAKS